MSTKIKGGKCIWIEDAATVYDLGHTTLHDYWQVLFHEKLDLKQAVASECYGDTTVYLMPNGKLAIRSYRGNSVIEECLNVEEASKFGHVTCDEPCELCKPTPWTPKDVVTTPSSRPDAGVALSAATRKYRKKPIVIEAIRVAEACRAAERDWKALPAWLAAQYEEGNVLFTPDSIYLRRPEGSTAGFRLDWVVCEGGLVSIVPADTFANLYEEVAE